MTKLVPGPLRRSIDDVGRNFRHAFDRWLTSRETSAPGAVGEWPTRAGWSAAPVVDVDEDDEAVTVTAELPGLDAKDFDVELQGNRLVLRGEKKASREEKKRSYYYSECSYGSFYRAIPLPCEVDANKTDASYKRGVLKIRLPKTEEAKARQVRVEVK